MKQMRWAAGLGYAVALGTLGTIPLSVAQTSAGTEGGGTATSEPAATLSTIAVPAESPPPIDASSTSGGQLSEVIVTAQKRSQNLQDVPLSVTAISAKDLRQQNITDSRQLADYAPNLQITSSPGFNFIRMRGVGSEYNRGVEQSVGIVIDDVSYGRPSYLNMGYLDLSSVEVLRGPQGTLFGKNAPAGVVHFHTADPNDTPELDTELATNNDHLHRIESVLNGPIIGDRLLDGRLAFLRESRIGDIYNTTQQRRVDDLDNTDARLKLLSQPGNFRVLASFDYMHAAQHGPGLQLYRVTPRALAAMQVYDPETTADISDQRNHEDIRGEVRRRSLDGTLNASWDSRHNFEIRNIFNAAYMRETTTFDPDFSPIAFLKVDNNEDYHQISNELRFSSTDRGPLEWVAGLFYYRTHVVSPFILYDYLQLPEIIGITGAVESSLDFNCSNPLLPCWTDQTAVSTAAATEARARQQATGTPLLEHDTHLFDQSSNSYAGFGQFTWHVTKKVALTAGARYTVEIKKLDFSNEIYNDTTGGTGVVSAGNPTGAVIIPVIQQGAEDFSQTASRRETDFSPKFSAQYYFTDHVNVYATFAKGFKSGGYNAQALNAQQLEYGPESSLTYEAGLRSKVLGGALRFNLSGFYTDYRNLQISSPTGVGFTVGNVPKAHTSGVELDAGLALSRWLILNGTGAYTVAAYDDFKSGPCPTTMPNGSICDLTGRTMPYVPRWSWTQNVVTHVPVFGDYSLEGVFTAVYSTSQYTQTNLDPVDRRPAGFMLRAGLGLADAERRYALTFFVDNIANRAMPAASTAIATFSQSHYAGVMPLRTYELKFKLMWF
ncbi:TonB-dependent receptor [Solimonas marina]|uniref:TonB-dependent receptor n=1 Tax=Solimonas marina TaxID=2714601 RepID=A0A969WDS5_9GAMM|nr:TonB-dependent receptor [Solimonas marina]NKF23536.1 TonB-dependent receptor [Solimonas marina]